ncbi:hypothetical protein ACFL1B_05590, partial [Nanoarchaeota archaeon]
MILWKKETLNSDLAEFVGILLGDGCMTEINKQITISCGTIDGSYIHEHIPYLIKELFNRKTGINTTRSWGLAIHCRFSSK